MLRELFVVPVPGIGFRAVHAYIPTNLATHASEVMSDYATCPYSSMVLQEKEKS